VVFDGVGEVLGLDENHRPGRLRGPRPGEGHQALEVELQILLRCGYEVGLRGFPGRAGLTLSAADRADARADGSCCADVEELSAIHSITPCLDASPRTHRGKRGPRRLTDVFPFSRFELSESQRRRRWLSFAKSRVEQLEECARVRVRDRPQA